MSSESRSQAPPIQTTSFPIETLTSDQREALTDYLTVRKESRVDLQQPLSLIRLLVNHKPGVILSSISDASKPTTVEDVLSHFDIQHKRIDDRYFAARTAWRFDFLPTLDSYSDGSHRRLGVFLGYPRADIEHFIHSEPPNTAPTVFIENGVFDPEDVAFTRFLPQRHDDTIEGYRRAIAAGKEIWTVLSRYAAQWDVPELSEYMRWLYQQSLEGLCGDWYRYQLHWPSKT